MWDMTMCKLQKIHQSFKDMLLTSYPEKRRNRPVHSVDIILSHYVVSHPRRQRYSVIAMKTLYAQLVYTELAESITAITEHSDIPH
jgi:hypothetical protein